MKNSEVFFLTGIGFRQAPLENLDVPYYVKGNQELPKLSYPSVKYAF